MRTVRVYDSIRITGKSQHPADADMGDKFIGKVFTVFKVDEDGDPWLHTDITYSGQRREGVFCAEALLGMTFEIVEENTNG